MHHVKADGGHAGQSQQKPESCDLIGRNTPGDHLRGDAIEVRVNLGSEGLIEHEQGSERRGRC